MGIKRVVDTSFWNDEKVVELFSPEDKYFMLYLLTNEHSTQLGIFKVPAKRIAYEMGYSEETAKTLIERFETKYGIIKQSKTSGEIAIKNYLRYSILKGGKPVLDQLRRESAEVRDRTLFDFIRQGAEKSRNETVQEFCKELFGGNLSSYNSSFDNAYINNENENENENEESYHESYNESPYESYHESYHESSKKKYGAFQNVEMTDQEFNALRDTFPDYQSKIDRLSEYMRSSGRTYNNHYATLLSWANKDEEKKKEQRRQNPVHFESERTYTDEQIAEIQRRAEAR